MKTDVYVYPAVFSKEPNGRYYVRFPDFEDYTYNGCETITETIDFVSNSLAFMIINEYESCDKPVPTPSAITDIKCKDGEFTSYIITDTLQYRQMFMSKPVKKTLTIPAYLDAQAKEAGINFSAVLQEALLEIVLEKQKKILDRY